MKNLLNSFLLAMCMALVLSSCSKKMSDEEYAVKLQNQITQSCKKGLGSDVEEELKSKVCSCLYDELVKNHGVKYLRLIEEQGLKDEAQKYTEGSMNACVVRHAPRQSVSPQ